VVGVVVGIGVEVGVEVGVVVGVGVEVVVVVVNKFINIDQKHRPRLIEHGHIVLTGLIAVIALLSLALVLSVNEANALRGELVQNLAISPDAAEYMHRLGDGLVFDDQEVE
jgi:heme/copper-type cytochrome/quinol oxidase subunit 4